MSVTLAAGSECFGVQMVQVTGRIPTIETATSPDVAVFHSAKPI